MTDNSAEDVILHMELFRMMRDGGYRKAAPFLEDARKAFPEVPEEKLRQVIRKIVTKMIEHQ